MAGHALSSRARLDMMKSECFKNKPVNYLCSKKGREFLYDTGKIHFPFFLLMPPNSFLPNINKNTCTHYGYNQVCKETMGIKANQAEEEAANHTADDTCNDIAESAACCFHDSAGNPAGKSPI